MREWQGENVTSILYLPFCTYTIPPSWAPGLKDLNQSLRALQGRGEPGSD